VFALALLAVAWAAGYIDMVWVADTSRLSAAIAVVFVLGLAFGCRAAVAISRDLNRVRRRADEFPHEPVDNLKERLRGRIAVVRHTANTLVFLGLIGTVIGFIVALSGVKPGDAGDASAIAPMVSTLIHGMSVALYTTLVGSVFALWLTVLHRILATGASKLLCAARVAAYA
jgi:biopolymer transport protein ExbB/TolQ